MIKEIRANIQELRSLKIATVLLFAQVADV